MEYLALIGTALLLHLLAVVSPGPDFVMVLKNTLTHNRRAGIMTAVGFGLGIGVHVLYSVVGLALIISQSILLFSIIKLLGAAYLIYIGIKSLRSVGGALPDVAADTGAHPLSDLAAIRDGFLTNILNPKATLFFLSLFTLVLSPTTPTAIVLLTGGLMMLNTTLWFCCVTLLFSHARVRRGFLRYQSLFNKTFGALLIALGLKVALSK